MIKLEGADAVWGIIQKAFADIREPTEPRFRNSMMQFEEDLAAAFGPGGSGSDRLSALSEYPDLVFSMQPRTLAWFMPSMLEACLKDPQRFFDLYTKLDFLFRQERTRNPADAPHVEELDAAFTPMQRAAIGKFFAVNRAYNPNLHPDDAEPLRL